MDDLPRRLADGEPAAFEVFYDLLAEPIHRYLIARVGSRPDADDLLQETFVRLARTRHALAAVSDLRAYVFAIARNEARRFLERQGRERRSLAVMSLETTGPSGQAAQDDADWAAHALGQLAEDVREIVELKIYGGLTLREIGQATGLPQGTVATRYRRALQTLRGLSLKDLE